MRQCKFKTNTVHKESDLQLIINFLIKKMYLINYIIIDVSIYVCINRIIIVSRYGICRAYTLNDIKTRNENKNNTNNLIEKTKNIYKVVIYNFYSNIGIIKLNVSLFFLQSKIIIVEGLIDRKSI